MLQQQCSDEKADNTFRFCHQYFRFSLVADISNCWAPACSASAQHKNQLESNLELLDIIKTTLLFHKYMYAHTILLYQREYL